MVFQARKWGWKRIAAQLLLIPVLGGASAAVAHAQARTGGAPAGQSSATAAPVMNQAPPGRGNDPKQLLKDGRKALAESRFNDAQDLAQAAAANNQSGKWGLFDDTPNALLKDIQAARQKAEKAEAEQLLKDAKALLHKSAANDGERAYNLDEALKKVRKADQLHGPYSVWDMGDRPDKLAKDIEAAKAKLRGGAVPTPPGGATAGGPSGGPMTFASTLPPSPDSGVRPAGGPNVPPPSGVVPADGPPSQPGAVMPAGGPNKTAPSSLPIPVSPTAQQPTQQPTQPPAQGGMDPKKVAAIKLMGDAKQLADQGNFAAAKAKLLDAERCGAVFSTQEPNPGFALRELNVRGAETISQLVRNANEQIGKKDFVKAEASLNAASEIVAALGLYRQPVEEAKTALRQASGGKYGGAAPGGSTPAPTPGAQATAPTGPAPFPAVNPVSPVTPVAPPPTPASPTAVRPTPTPTPTPMAIAAPAMPPGPATVSGRPTPSTPAPTGPVTAAPAPTAPAPTGSATGTPPPAGPVAVAPAPSSPTTGTPAGPVTAAPAPSTPATGAPATGGSVTGRQLLDQAAMAFRAGDLDVAQRLALQAHNAGRMQEEARGLLNQIDAEKLATRQRSASKSFDAAVAAHANRDYSHAMSVFVLIDPNLLTPEKRAKRDELMATCRLELEKSSGMSPGAVATTAGAQEPPLAPMVGPAAPPMADPMTPPATNPPGSARIGTGAPTDPRPVDPNNLTNQVEAMRRVTFQKLRSDGLKVQADAQAAFGRGETDVAIHMLVDYANRVRSSELEPGSVALLLRPIESRLEMFRVMKGQTDAIAREKKANQDAKDLIVGRGAAEEQRKAEVQRLVRDCTRYAKAGDYAAAEKAALQAKQLDPDNEAVGMLAQMIKMQRRVKEQEALKDEKERFNYGAWTDAEKPGPLVTTENPVAIQIEASLRANRRGSLDDVYLRSRSPREFQIELQLDNPVSNIEFNQTPLSEVINNLRSLSGLPIMFDAAALEAEGLSTAKPITVNPGAPISTRNLLHVTLEQAGMSFVVEHDMVKITTLKKSKGRLFTKVFSVADLVTPIPNFALPDYGSLDKMLSRSPLNSGKLQLSGVNGPTPYTAPNSLQGGVPAGTMPGLNPGIAPVVPSGPGGTLQQTPAGSSPLSGVANLGPDRNTKHEQLIKLITGMVRPYSWDANGMGGPGQIQYYDVGSALVVNQTADVIREVADLLEALRRLQDLAIAVEIRIVSLSETFFERMGVDFSMNIKTHTAKFEPNLTSGIFRPEPFVNDINNKGVTIGLIPAGAGGSGPGVGPSFTPDLDVPIRATSFQYAIPPYGGYPNSPGFDGGISLGLAFLNDIQVYMFMEAAQGDRRANIMQAPKLTLFNGQTSTLTVTSGSFFVTDVTVVSVNGQIVFIPNNAFLPGPDTNFTIGIQAVVSADRRFVRMNLPVTLAAETGATVPLFPITTFITPVFEGGSQGVPIPFTQFLQQPSFTSLSIQTTVVCPDGGTVLLGGLKTLKEGRNEFGPPFLSKIPYLNRLWKNVGIGRETTHVMIMVTPRIIINAEEEINQTEGRTYGGFGPGQ